MKWQAGLLLVVIIFKYTHVKGYLFEKTSCYLC